MDFKEKERHNEYPKDGTDHNAASLITILPRVFADNRNFVYKNTACFGVSPLIIKPEEPVPVAPVPVTASEVCHQEMSIDSSKNVMESKVVEPVFTVLGQIHESLKDTKTEGEKYFNSQSNQCYVHSDDIIVKAEKCEGAIEKQPSYKSGQDVCCNAAITDVSVKTEYKVIIEVKHEESFKCESTEKNLYEKSMCQKTEDENALHLNIKCKEMSSDFKPEIVSCESAEQKTFLSTSEKGIGEGDEVCSSTEEKSVSGLYNCNQCNKVFTYATNLYRHKSTVHEKNKPLKCNICNEQFFRKDHLKKHMSWHGKVTVFKCNDCDKTYSSARNLEWHMLSHSKEKTFRCSQCIGQFTTNEQLLEHMLTHSGKRNFICDVCKKAFRTIGTLRQHKVTHKETSLRNKVACNLCGKNFTRACSLKRHMTKHTGDKSYKCDTCGKSYTRPFSLKTHICSGSAKEREKSAKK